MEGEGGEKKNFEVERRELLERLSYALAELNNMRRIMDKEVERAEAAVVERMMRKLILFYEDFDRVVKEIRVDDASHALIDALRMLLKQLENILTSEGVEKMDVVGKEFNPFDHEAVEYLESDEVDVDTVAEVISHGYRIKDRILKPPKVKVLRAKRPRS